MHTHLWCISPSLLWMMAYLKGFSTRRFDSIYVTVFDSLSLNRNRVRDSTCSWPRFVICTLKFSAKFTTVTWAPVEGGIFPDRCLNHQLLHIFLIYRLPLYIDNIPELSSLFLKCWSKAQLGSILTNEVDDMLPEEPEKPNTRYVDSKRNRIF